MDGNKETKIFIDEWREDLEEYLNSYFPDIKHVMEKAARWKLEIND